jgi:hypothetical protein
MNRSTLPALQIVSKRDDPEYIAPSDREIEAKRICDRFANYEFPQSITADDRQFIEDCRTMAITTGRVFILMELEEKYFGK